MSVTLVELIECLSRQNRSKIRFVYLLPVLCASVSGPGLEKVKVAFKDIVKPALMISNRNLAYKITRMDGWMDGWMDG